MSIPSVVPIQFHEKCCLICITVRPSLIRTSCAHELKTYAPERKKQRSEWNKMHKPQRGLSGRTSVAHVCECVSILCCGHCRNHNSLIYVSRSTTYKRTQNALCELAMHVACNLYSLAQRNYKIIRRKHFPSHLHNSLLILPWFFLPSLCFPSWMPLVPLSRIESFSFSLYSISCALALVGSYIGIESVNFLACKCKRAGKSLKNQVIGGRICKTIIDVYILRVCVARAKHWHH